MSTSQTDAVAPSAQALLDEAGTALDAYHVRGAHELYTRALDAADNPRSRGEALEGLGLVASQAGRPREAVRLLKEAVELLGEEVSQRPLLAETLGRAYAEVGDLERATVVFEECRRRFEREGDRVNEVRFACLLGYALTDRGEFAEAETVLAQTLTAGEGIDEPLVRVRLCWAQARLRGEQGQAEIAAKHAEEALDILRAADARPHLAPQPGAEPLPRRGVQAAGRALRSGVPHG